MSDPVEISTWAKILGPIVGFGGLIIGALGLRNRAKDKEERAVEARDKAIDERISRHDLNNKEHIEVVKRALEARRVAEIDIFRQLGAEGPIMKAIGGLTEQTGRFQAEVLREFATRPTRHEVTDLIDRSARG